jgi:hypothetical protein
VEGGVIKRLVAAVVMLALAAVLALLARDAWRWDRALRDADQRAAVRAVGPGAWQADSTLPWGAARRLLGIDDDLRFRQTAMRVIKITSALPPTTSRKVRAPVEGALARMVHGDSDHARASRAADYLGYLLYTDPAAPAASANPYVDPSQPGQSIAQQTPEEKATAEFAIAVQLDPGNANAKSNLEVMLRRPKPPTQQGSPRPGGGERIGNRGSGARPAGRGY